MRLDKVVDGVGFEALQEGLDVVCEESEAVEVAASAQITNHLQPDAAELVELPLIVVKCDTVPN